MGLAGLMFILALYNITKGTTAAKGNELGIFEDIGDVYAQEDLDLFFATYAPYVRSNIRLCSQH